MKKFIYIFSILISIKISVLSREIAKDTIYQMPPVLVTATYAFENETPVTFSNLNYKEILERYTMQDFPTLISELPSIINYSFNGNDIGYSFITLRGFDQRRLSVMINGIPQNDPEDHQVYWIDMPDLLGYTNNVQVQRGAGNIFYGPPAIGGSINIITTPIDVTPRISFSTIYGFQEFGEKNKTLLNSRKYALTFSSGLINNKYHFYGSLSKITSDGYRYHSWANLYSYFFGVTRKDNDMITRVNIYGGPIEDAHAYVGIPKYFNKDKKLRRANYSYWEFSGDTIGYATLHKTQAIEKFFQPHYELINEWKIFEKITMHNTLFYIQGDGFFDYDGDWVQYDPFATNWFRNYVGYDSLFGTDQKFVSLLLKGYVSNKQFGWLPRIDYQHTYGKLTLGGEVRIHRSTHWGKIQYASEYPSPTYDPDFRFYEYNGEKDILSLFSNKIYDLDKDTKFMLNLQFVYNRYGIRNEKFLNNKFDIKYYFINPRIGINRNFSDKINAYFTIAYTSREPRLRNLYAAEDAWFGDEPKFEKKIDGSFDFSRPFAKPEHLLNLEVGGSYNHENAKLSANIYFMDFNNELVKSGKIDIFGGSVLINANKTRHYGIELEASYNLTDQLQLSGNTTISSNKIISHKFYDEKDSVWTLDGNPIAGFPDMLANLRLKYMLNEFSTSFYIKYVGEFYTDNLKDEKNKVDAFTVMDFDLSYNVKKLLTTDVSFIFKVRNLFNKLYMAYGEGSSFFPAAERNYQIGIVLNY